MENVTEEFDSRYTRVYSNYEAFARSVKEDFEYLLKGFDITGITYRAKGIDSAIAKSRKSDKDGKPKYGDPKNEITDLAGVRVIARTLVEIPEICRIIEQKFKIDG